MTSALGLIILSVSACSNGSKGAAEQTGSTGASSAPASATATAEASATTAPPTTPPPSYAKVVFAKTVKQGDKGADTARVQQRLKDLGFDPGPVDGRFGEATTEAVWAYQKLIGLTGKAVDGRVSPTLWSRIQDPLAIAPMDTRTANHVEVDLVKQVVIVWNGNTARLITHVSTGSNKPWCEKGWCGTAVTPPGVYKFNRRVSGWHEAVLGLLYNPVYFNGGIAIHGALSVPLRPASHGCVRLPMHIADYFPSLVHNGDEVLVFDGIKSPRAYGQISPPANTPDPTATTAVPADPEDTADPTIPTTAPAPASSAATPTTLKAASPPR
jgi:peptidoglycan hydrolase-like protein with peptidoglycan-binding domain